MKMSASPFAAPGFTNPNPLVVVFVLAHLSANSRAFLATYII